MNVTAAKELFFGSHSWLFFAGRDEDGTEIHHEGYCVQAEDSKGYRWNHNKVFLLSDFIRKAEGDTTKARDLLEQKMSVLADKMKLHVNNGGKLNEYLWEEDEPSYGSVAYCEAYGC